MSENPDTITIIYDQDKRKCRLVSANYHFIKCIIQHFTTENPAAFILEQHGYNISNELSVINALGYFDIGLFPLVFKALKQYYPAEVINIPDKNLILNTIFPLKDQIKYNDIQDVSQIIKMRPYQIEAVKRSLKYGRGLIECPTGSGKSLIIGNIIHNLNDPRLNPSKPSVIVIYVPTRQLVDQFYTDLLEYGFTKDTICKFSSTTGKKKDGSFSDNSCKDGFKQVIITNRDFLNHNKEKLPKIDVLICDEVHTLAPNSKSIFFINNIETNIKIGFTGSVPVNEYHKWILFGIFGSVLFSESTINLQDQGYLAPLNITSIELFDNYVNGHTELLFSLKTIKKFDNEDLSEDAQRFNDAYNEEIEYINKNLFKLYKQPLDYICNTDCNNILILFDRVEFGQNIYLEAKNNILNRDVYYIDGSIDINTREQIRINFEKQNGGVLFAQSKTFSTGINIKNLDCIAFFFSGKGHTKVIQSIGRTLRLHKDKEYAQLFDISFNYKYAQKHKKERMNIYNEYYGKNKYDKIIKLSI
jgi:superfamily II DNA or RNA helicase